jgi:PAS domain S-box-containing protein
MRDTPERANSAEPDLTDSSRVDQSLRHSELRYRRLFETTQDGILILDALTGVITDVNPYLVDLLGYPREEFIGRKLWQVGALKDVEASKDALEALQRDEYIRYEHLPLKAKDGRLLQVEFVSNVYLVGEDKVIQCNIRDITAHRRLIAELEDNERQYHSLVTHSPDGMFLIDKSGDFSLVNKAMCDALGFTDAELRSMNIWDIVPELYLEQHRTRLAKILEGKALHEPAEYVVHGKAGQELSIEVRSAPYYGKKGIVGFQGIARDVTGCKRAEEDIRHRVTEMEALHTVSIALRVAQTRDEALPILLDETLTALATDAGAIWLYRPDIDELHAAVTRGWFRQYDETPLKPGEGIVGTVFATGQPYTTMDFADDPLSRRPIAGHFPTGWGGICVPIRTGATPVGTMTICVPAPRQLTAAQLKLLESLAEMGGAALHRMRLHDEALRQVGRLETLHSIDLAIASSVDLSVTLNILLEHITTQLSADAARVLLVDPHSQTLEYAAGRGFRTRSAQTAHTRLGEDFAGRAALERRTVQAVDPAQVQNSRHFAALWAFEGFAAYCGVPLIAKGEVKGVLEVYHRAPFHAEWDWISFLETIAEQAAIAIHSAQLLEDLHRSNVELALAYDATIEGWSRALDLRDYATEGHTQRVTEITMRLAKAMGISDAELVHVRRGALLHDIGKMGVPDDILLKPGPLTDDEWKVMRLHPKLAYELLSPIGYLHGALDIPYCHHERWDGSGYPRGLIGEQIPLAARVFAVADVWDALRSDRPYRLAWAEDKVLEHIRSIAGILLDPQVVRVCLELRILETSTPERSATSNEKSPDIRLVSRRG